MSHYTPKQVVAARENGSRLILDVSQQLTRNLSRREVYHTLAQGLMKTGADRCTLHTLHDLDVNDVPQTGQLVFENDRKTGEKQLLNEPRYSLKQYPSLLPMVANQKPLVIVDVETDERLTPAERQFWQRFHIRSLVAAPIVIRQRMYGYVTIEYRQPTSFDEHMLTLYQILCNQAAVAIQNARQVEYTTDALTSAQVLYRAGRILANTDNPQKALQDALLEYLYSLNLDQGAIIQLSPDDRYGYPIVYIENYEFRPVENLRFPIQKDSPYLQELFSGQPMVCADVDNDPRLQNFIAFNPERQPKSLLAAPIILQGEIIGWIGADAVHERKYFSQHEVDLARAMADQVAIAIQNHRLIEETRRRADQFQAVAEVGESIAGLIDLNEILNKTVNLIRERFGFYHVSIFLLDDTETWAVVRASTGEVGKIMVERPHRLAVGGKSIVGFVTGNAQPRIALDVGQDAVHFNNPLLPNTRSEMALPLIARGKVIGALDVQSKQAGAFTNEDIETLQIMADQLAAVISNARMFEQLQTSLTEQGTLYHIGTKIITTLDLREAAHILVYETTKALHVTECALSLLEKEGRVRLLSDYTQDSHSMRCLQGEFQDLHTCAVLPQVLQTRHQIVVYIDSMPDQTTILAIEYLRKNNGTALAVVPIMLQNQIIGFLEVYDNKPKRHFSPSELALLDSIALLTANAIRNARLYENSQKTLERTRVLSQISNILSTATDRKTIFETVLQEYLKLIGLKFGSIMLLDKTRENSVIHARVMNGRLVQPNKIFPFEEDAVIQHLISHPTPLVIDRTRPNPFIKPKARPSKTKVMLFIPLIVQNKVVGILTADSPDENYVFPQADINLGNAIAEQLSIWLENLQLLEEIQRHFALLQTAAEVSRAASSILNVDQLIQTSVDLIRDHFDFYYVGLFLVDQSGEWAVLRAGTGEAGRRQIEAGHRLKIGGESMIGWSIAHRQARIALDVGEEAVHFRNPYLPDTHSEMALPLISRDEVIGALTVQSVERAAFSDEDITVLQTMADQLANAITNARLFTASEKAARRETIIAEITSKIRNSINVDDIMQTTVMELGKVVGASRGRIALTIDQSTDD